MKRAYGDWTTTNLRGWKEVLHKMAIQPMQQFSYTTGKNSTDSSLIIDAMDLLHSGSFNGFCLVSSDSDFTRLATRIREAGLVVYGFGERKSPQPFVAACDKFIYTEILKPQSAPTPQDEPSAGTTGADDSYCGECDRPRQWMGGPFGGRFDALKNSPSFDPRNYGCQKLGELVRKQPYLEVKEIPVGDGSTNVYLYVRLKTAKSPLLQACSGKTGHAAHVKRRPQ